MMLHDLMAAGPILVVVTAGMLTLLAEAASPKTLRLQWFVALAACLVAGVWGWMSAGTPSVGFGGMLSGGGAAGYWAAVFSVSGGFCIMLSSDYLERTGIAHGEYYALLLFGVAGMMLMAAAADLIIFFLGLELMSLDFYVLAGFARGRGASNEAALKYFLLGAFATGFLLYGIAMIYGATGTTHVGNIAGAAGTLAGNPLFVIGLALILVGLSFKVAAVPFHMWAPDVYEGSPTTVSAFMSTGGKAAAFSVFLVLFSPPILVSIPHVRELIAVVAALSMVVGNLLALPQTNVKRMLAYSSVAHAGYILVGVVAGNTLGSSGVLFYLMAYTLMNAGAFGVLSILETPEGGNLTFDEYQGIGRRRPFLAGIMALFMFSLAGIPPFAGFFGKYLVFAGAIQGGYTWLAILGVVMSIVSVYYYLRLIVVMFFREGGAENVLPESRVGTIAVALAAVALFGFGVAPSLILNLTHFFF